LCDAVHVVVYVAACVAVIYQDKVRPCLEVRSRVYKERYSVL